MLIVNNHAFKGTDPRITPSIRHGSLLPSSDYATEELANAAPKSIYLSCIYDHNGCTLGEPMISMWIKAKRSGDECTGGTCTDWQEISVGGISRGTTPPVGSDPEFCCQPAGAWYIQMVGNMSTCNGDAPQPYIWLKVAEHCGTNDWALVSPAVAPIYFGDADPNTDDNNCELPVGAVFYQYCPGRDNQDCVIIESTSSGNKQNLIRWEKVQSCCEGSDWLNTTKTPVVQLAAGVEFDCTADAIECLPVGGIVYRVTPAAGDVPEICEMWIRLGCADADNCGDWCRFSNYVPEPEAKAVFFGDVWPAEAKNGDVLISGDGTACRKVWQFCDGENILLDHATINAGWFTGELVGDANAALPAATVTPFPNASFITQDTSLDQGGTALVTVGSPNLQAPDCCAFVVTAGGVIEGAATGDKFEVRLYRTDPGGSTFNVDGDTVEVLSGSSVDFTLLANQPELPGSFYFVEVFNPNGTAAELQSAFMNVATTECSQATLAGPGA